MQEKNAGMIKIIKHINKFLLVCVALLCCTAACGKSINHYADLGLTAKHNLIKHYTSSANVVDVSTFNGRSWVITSDNRLFQLTDGVAGGDVDLPKTQNASSVDVKLLNVSFTEAQGLLVSSNSGVYKRDVEKETWQRLNTSGNRKHWGFLHVDKNVYVYSLDDYQIYSVDNLKEGILPENYFWNFNHPAISLPSYASRGVHVKAMDVAVFGQEILIFSTYRNSFYIFTKVNVVSGEVNTYVAKSSLNASEIHSVALSPKGEPIIADDSGLHLLKRGSMSTRKLSVLTLLKAKVGKRDQITSVENLGNTLYLLTTDFGTGCSNVYQYDLKRKRAVSFLKRKCSMNYAGKMAAYNDEGYFVLFGDSAYLFGNEKNAGTKLWVTRNMLPPKVIPSAREYRDYSSESQTENNRRHFITFISDNDTAYGHSYVVWNTFNTERNIWNAPTAEGYWLADAGLGRYVRAVFGGPGTLQTEDFYSHSDNLQSLIGMYDSKAPADTLLNTFPEHWKMLTIQVDEAVYNNTRMHSQAIGGAPGEYRLLANDCIDYIRKIADTAGLSLPIRSYFPSGELIGLIRVTTTPQYYFSAELTYYGTMYDNKPFGEGRLVHHPMGTVFIGKFRFGVLHGVAQVLAANGDEFNGMFVNGKRTGQGVYTFASGGHYSGLWLNNNRSGPGTYTFSDGSKWVGNYLNDKPAGNGTFYFADGSVRPSRTNSDGSVVFESHSTDERVRNSHSRNDGQPTDGSGHHPGNGNGNGDGDGVFPVRKPDLPDFLEPNDFPELHDRFEPLT